MEEPKPSVDFPIEESKYQQNVEEMKQLIPFIKEEMKSCPNDELTFDLIETVDFYTLKRFFKLKSSSSNNKSLSQFKETLLTNISNLDSFIAIPKKNSFALDAASNKGNSFKSPKVYNLDGDESVIDFGSGEGVLFLYDNGNDLNLFLGRNKNLKMACFCVGVNVNFFEQKKMIKKSGFLNINNAYFYFIDDEQNGKPNPGASLKFNHLPRALLVDSSNVIREDKFLRSIHTFVLEKDLINHFENKSGSSEEQKKIDSNFVLLENENKRKVIRAMNIYIRDAGLNDVHFYVKSKVSIDKKGIKKTKCYPVFYGDTTKVGKELIDNLIGVLNGQELFRDFRNEVTF